MTLPRLLAAAAVATAALFPSTTAAHATDVCASGRFGELCVGAGDCLVSGWVNGIPALLCVWRP